MCRVVKAMFKLKVISREIFVVRNTLFQRTVLKGSDKRDWMPRLRVDSMTHQLPGTICQNSKFIQLFSMLLYKELAARPDVLKTEIWQFYLYLKRFCELINAASMSEEHLAELQSVYVAYLELRIKFSLPTPSSVKSRQDEDEEEDWCDTDEDITDENMLRNVFKKVTKKKVTKGVTKRAAKAKVKKLAKKKAVKKVANMWPKVSPKHTFILCYNDIIRQIGCVSWTHTNRAESKNGQHKRKARLANNSKNIPMTILRSDNEYHASCLKRGALNDIEVEVNKEGTTLCHDQDFFRWLQIFNFEQEFLLADEVTVRQVKYTNDDQVVMLSDKDATEAFVMIRKIAVQKKSVGTPIVKLIYQKTDARYLEEFGLYHLVPQPVYDYAYVTDLSTPFPLYHYKIVHKGAAKLVVSLKCTL